MAGISQVLTVQERDTERFGVRYHACRNDVSLAHFGTYLEADCYLAGMIRAIGEASDAIRKIA